MWRFRQIKGKDVCLWQYIDKKLFYDWSPTTSVIPFKYLLTDAIQNKAAVHQVGSIQAFIQSNTKKRFFEILGKEYETICSHLAEYVGRPLRL